MKTLTYLEPRTNAKIHSTNTSITAIIARMNDHRTEQSPGLYIVACGPQTSFISLLSQPVGNTRIPINRNMPKKDKKIKELLINCQ